MPDGALCAPLIGRGGRLLGHIHLAGKTKGDFTQDDKAILIQLAHMAALAYDNARLYEELRESDRHKDEFLATLAHELRNPLAPIRNSIHVMRLAGDDRATIDGSLAMIERQVQQMVRLVDDLLDLSRISRGQIKLRTERVDLATILTSAVETSRPLIEQSAHELAIALPDDPIPLVADPTRLVQVFSNLLNNSARYTEPGGHIWLSAQREDDCVTVRMRDSGVGIPPEMLPRIFEMFMQVDQSLERAQGGLGIGLKVVKRLVEMHGGSIEAHSEGPNRGSEFVVRLPVALDLKATPPAAAGGGHAAPRSHRRILVVDDNRDSADSLTTMLNIMGNEVRTAHDGQEAVDLAATFDPEVVLMDIGLPMLNGFDAARRMRDQPGGKGMVIVALTGWGQEEDRRRSQEAGFDHHFVKPVDPFALEKLLDGLGTITSRSLLEHRLSGTRFDLRRGPDGHGSCSACRSVAPASPPSLRMERDFRQAPAFQVHCDRVGLLVAARGVRLSLKDVASRRNVGERNLIASVDHSRPTPRSCHGSPLGSKGDNVTLRFNLPR